MRDDLTGLAGMGAVQARLAQWQEAAEEGKAAPVHAMLIELGRFDTVNLAYGEAAGDRALVTTAQRISHFAEDEFEEGNWIAARLGGGKFLLAAYEGCSRERWQWLAEALAEAIAHPIAELDGLGLDGMGLDGMGTMRLWPRIALMRPVPGEGPSMILDSLAETLERARGQHSRRVIWGDDRLTIPGRRSALIDAELLSAIDRDEIAIVFQPQASLKNGDILGAEALARWRHPELGQVGASQLFRIADRTDHVAQLSRHIAEKSLTLAAQWPAHLRLSLNITPADLAAPSFGKELLALVERCGFSPDRLTLEITEHVLLENLEDSAKMLQILQDAGMKIALDDFGAGFCNFNYLKLLPLDAIKLDRAMVVGITEDKRDLIILRGIIAMAKALNLDIIIEGIENEAQHAIVTAEGGDSYQGFLQAKPMKPDEFLNFAGQAKA